MKMPAPITTCLFLAALMFTAGCNTRTPYQQLSMISPIAGGYSDVQLGEDHYQVEFVGNVLTSRERVESYLLFRAAELTIEHGANWFVVVDREMDHETVYLIRPDLTYHLLFGARFGEWRPYWSYEGPNFGWRDWDPYHGDPFWTHGVDVQMIETFKAAAEIRLGPFQQTTREQLPRAT